MKLKQVNSDFFLSDQIIQQDLEKIAEEGIKTILCNRPDGEGADQPNIIEIEQAAKNSVFRSNIYQSPAKLQMDRLKNLKKSIKMPKNRYWHFAVQEHAQLRFGHYRKDVNKILNRHYSLQKH